MEPWITCEKIGPVAVITLDKPKKKNAMDVAMMARLTAVVDEMNEDASVRVMVLKGAGHCFCAGGDLSAYQGEEEPDAATIRADIGLFGKTVSAIHRGQKIVIAMVESYAIGGGFSLALACDVIFAAEDAVFSANFLHVGLAPEMGGMLYLPLAVGMYRAKEIWLSGRRIGAEEAGRLGIASRVIPNAAIEEETMRFAQTVAKLPAMCVDIMKKTAGGSYYRSFDAVLAQDQQNTPLCLTSEESRRYLAENFKKKK